MKSFFFSSNGDDLKIDRLGNDVILSFGNCRRIPYSALNETINIKKLTTQIFKAISFRDV